MAGRNPRARGRDMALSLLVLLVPLLAIVWFFTVDPEPTVERVDVGPTLARAEEESPYPVLRPVNLPQEWVPTRVAWARDGERWITGEPAVGNAWQLGHLSPSGIYIGLQQRDRDPAGFLADITRDGRRVGTEVVTAAGREWEHWQSDDGRTRSLVWRDGDLVAAVTGDTGFEELAAFAQTLEA